MVTEKFRIDWNTYLAGTKDYIVGQIDGRGSSGQGYRLLHEVYRRLGTVEVSDQLEVTEYLRDSLHFVDKRRVGIWGWSYGGYTSAMALASPLSLFQCGVSVSPVVSWKLYGKRNQFNFISSIMLCVRVKFTTAHPPNPSPTHPNTPPTPPRISIQTARRTHFVAIQIRTITLHSFIHSFIQSCSIHVFGTVFDDTKCYR